MKPLLQFLRKTGAVALFAVRLLLLALTPPYYPAETLRIMARVACRCVIPVVFVVAPFGMVIALQGLLILQRFGAEGMIGSVLVVSMLRELSPGMTGIMMAAQTGSTFAAEISTMRVNEEIDAYTVMAVDPLRFLILPRLTALTLVCPLIHALGCFAGIGCGVGLAVWVKGVSAGALWENMTRFMGLVDVWGGMAKTAVFGFLIGAISCYEGLLAREGAVGVGRAANRAVVVSITTFLFVNVFLTAAIFSLGGG